MHKRTAVIFVVSFFLFLQTQHALADDNSQPAPSAAAAPKLTEDIYSLTADILGNAAKDGNGDPEAMLKLLEQAQKDPEAFVNKLPPEQQKKLKDISDQMPQSK